MTQVRACNLCNADTSQEPHNHSLQDGSRMTKMTKDTSKQMALQVDLCKILNLWKHNLDNTLIFSHCCSGCKPGLRLLDPCEI